MEKTIISNEVEAAYFLEMYLKEPDSIDPRDIKFENWDNFNIHLTGDKFHNSITPSVMKGIIELQQALYEAFALAVYNDRNTSRLTHEQKKKLEIQVIVSEGTTNLDIDINAVFATFISATVGKMSSTQAMALFITFILVYFGHSAWKHWLDTKTALKEKEVDAETQKMTVETMSEANKKTVEAMTETNQKVIETLKKVAMKDEKAATVIEQSDTTRSRLVRSTRYADEVTIDEIAELSGEEAEYLTRQPRTEWEPVRLDGRYRLLEVNSSSTLNRKVRIRNLETHRELTAILEDQTLEKRHLEQLGMAEWGHHPAYLNIKAKMKGDLIKDAIITNVEKVEKDIVFDDGNLDEGDTE